ncbi:MAG: hypothetical protein WCP19_13975 [Chloroflexota bacterium]
MSSLDSLREIYPFDAKTGTFTIPTRLKVYADFFNPLDPSPAPSRDLSIDLVSYFNQCSEEIFDKYPLTLSIEIQSESRDNAREAECLQSLRTFYQHEIFVMQAEIRRQRMRALKYLLVSIACLSVYVISEGRALDYFPLTLLREAVLIGGWVFMWEAVTLNFIEMDSFIQKIRKHKRMISANVVFSRSVDK